MLVQGTLATEASRGPGIRWLWLRAIKHLKFVDGSDNSLASVEFRGPPLVSILQTICKALTAHRICIADSATQITEHALFQRFELREPDGRPLVGQRRAEVVVLFLKVLSEIAHNEQPAV